MKILQNGNVNLLPYWKTRWCENEQTAERTADIHPNQFKQRIIKIMMT